MKSILAAAALAAILLPAHAEGPPAAPEIDGSLALQFVALAGGIAMLLKKKNKR